MLGLTVDTVFDGAALTACARAAWYTAAEALGDAVLCDCDIYVPYDTGALCHSGGVSGVTEEDGRVGCDVTWSAPYAAAVYYGDARGVRFSPEHHAHARARWFDGARASCLDGWISGRC